MIVTPQSWKECNPRYVEFFSRVAASKNTDLLSIDPLMPELKGIRPQGTPISMQQLHQIDSYIFWRIFRRLYTELSTLGHCSEPISTFQNILARQNSSTEKQHIVHPFKKKNGRPHIQKDNWI